MTFVSGKGTHSGTCTELHPCRTFQFALRQTSPSGEIKTVDPADYGPMTITKSISITGVDQGTLDRVPLNHNGFGSSCCGTGGIRAAIASTRVSITNSAVTNNNHIGIDTDDSPTIRLAHSVVTGNDTGVNAGSGTVDSAGDNYIDGNGTNIIGTLIHVGTQ